MRPHSLRMPSTRSQKSTRNPSDNYVIGQQVFIREDWTAAHSTKWWWYPVRGSDTPLVKNIDAELMDKVALL